MGARPELLPFTIPHCGQSYAATTVATTPKPSSKASPDARWQQVESTARRHDGTGGPFGTPPRRRSVRTGTTHASVGLKHTKKGRSLAEKC